MGSQRIRHNWATLHLRTTIRQDRRSRYQKPRKCPRRGPPTQCFLWSWYFKKRHLGLLPRLYELESSEEGHRNLYVKSNSRDIFYLATLGSIVVLLSHVWLSVTPWTTAHQVSLSFTISRSLLKLMSIKSVMPSNRLLLCCPFLLLPSIFPSIRVFSNELVLCILELQLQHRPSSEYSGLIFFRIDWCESSYSPRDSPESSLRIRWPKCWIFSFSISPSNEYSGLISLEWTSWISLQTKGLSRVFSNTTVQKHQFFGIQLSL